MVVAQHVQFGGLAGADVDDVVDGDRRVVDRFPLEGGDDHVAAHRWRDAVGDPVAERRGRLRGRRGEDVEPDAWNLADLEPVGAEPVDDADHVAVGIAVVVQHPHEPALADRERDLVDDRHGWSVGLDRVDVDADLGPIDQRAVADGVGEAVRARRLRDGTGTGRRASVGRSSPRRRRPAGSARPGGHRRDRRRCRARRRSPGGRRSCGRRRCAPRAADWSRPDGRAPGSCPSTRRRTSRRPCTGSSTVPAGLVTSGTNVTSPSGASLTDPGGPSTVEQHEGITLRVAVVGEGVQRHALAGADRGVVVLGHRRWLVASSGAWRATRTVASSRPWRPSCTT